MTYCASTTPTVDITTPSHCLVERNSRPMSHDAIADTTGIRAAKTLDLATPSCLIVLTHNENAMLEHNSARHIIGIQTSPLRNRGSKLRSPPKIKNGKR